MHVSDVGDRRHHWISVDVNSITIITSRSLALSLGIAESMSTLIDRHTYAQAIVNESDTLSGVRRSSFVWPYRRIRACQPDQRVCGVCHRVCLCVYARGAIGEGGGGQLTLIACLVSTRVIIRNELYALVEDPLKVSPHTLCMCESTYLAGVNTKLDNEEHAR